MAPLSPRARRRARAHGRDRPRTRAALATHGRLRPGQGRAPRMDRAEAHGARRGRDRPHLGCAPRRGAVGGRARRPPSRAPAPRGAGSRDAVAPHPPARGPRPRAAGRDRLARRRVARGCGGGPRRRRSRRGATGCVPPRSRDRSRGRLHRRRDRRCAARRARRHDPARRDGGARGRDAHGPRAARGVVSDTPAPGAAPAPPVPAPPPGAAPAVPTPPVPTPPVPADDAFHLRVGERLRAIRTQKRLSLNDVEAESREEFKASVLGAYERGERAISVLRLQRLARIYGVTVDQLLPVDPQRV